MAVLWALVLISALVIALNLAVRSRVQTTANFAAREEARLLADGVAELVASDWIKPDRPVAETLGLKVDGRVTRCRVADNVVDIRMISVSGLVDINAAPAPLLEHLFLSLRMPEGKAKKLAAAIVDYRDADSDPNQGGAEYSAYIAAGFPFGPKNAPFETTGELDQVYGFSREIIAAIRSYVTVHSRSPMVDLAVALPELVVGFQSLSNDRKSTLGDFFGHAAQSSRIVRVFVSVETPRGVRVVRDATAELAPQSRRGFLWREWSLIREDRQMTTDAALSLRDCF